MRTVIEDLTVATQAAPANAEVLMILREVAANIFSHG
jgi:hypothetical protein